MLQTILRAFCGLSPLYVTPLARFTSEADARALACLLVCQGKRACIQSTPSGFEVAEVAK